MVKKAPRNESEKLEYAQTEKPQGKLRHKIPWNANTELTAVHRSRIIINFFATHKLS